MKQLFFSIIFCSLFITCKKNNPITINGFFIENNPVFGRSQLNFTTGNWVIKTETGSSFVDTFYYSISQTKIILTPNGVNQGHQQEFDFEKVDNNTIRIQNLYPSIPEATKTYMIYKK